MKINKNNTLLMFVLIIAFFLRTYKLSSIPPHLTPDEAALGYNAYSILKTGRDEYGVFFPMIFKSFGDYKPGLYVYATAPFIYLFGLNEFAVRIASALSGVVAVLMIYLISRFLFKNKSLALFSALFLSVMPWHIHFSRGAWEANFALTLSLVGLFFLFKSLQKNYYLLFAAALFGFSLLAYQGAKLNVLIILFIFLITNYKLVLKIDKKYLFSSFLIGLIIVLPIIKSFFDGRTGRLVVFSIFSYPRPESYLNNFLSQSGIQKNSFFYYIFYSENLNFLRGLLGRFFNHFSGRFLFFDGDWQNPRHSSPYYGMLLSTSFPIFIVGLIDLFKEKINKGKLFIAMWLLLSPLPAILSRDSVHAIRSLPLVVPLSFVLAFGTLFIIQKLKFIGKIIVVVIISTGLLMFLENYFIQMPVINAKYWEYGYKQIVQTITPIQNNYENIYVQQSYSQPYIYFLFYQKYSPEKYQKSANLKKGESEFDVGKVETLENIHFSELNWQTDRGKTKSLFAADPIKIPIEDSVDLNLFHVVSEIKDPNGIIIFRLIEVK